MNDRWKHIAAATAVLAGLGLVAAGPAAAQVGVTIHTGPDYHHHHHYRHGGVVVVHRPPVVVHHHRCRTVTSTTYRHHHRVVVNKRVCR